MSNSLQICKMSEVILIVTKYGLLVEGVAVLERMGVRAYSSFHMLFLAENIMQAHHYTSSIPATAAAAVNAGTSLEDANYYDNVFNHIGDAIKMVIMCDTSHDANIRF